MKTLAVLLDGKPVGTLAETGAGEIFFEYDERYLAGAGAVSLSPYHLPLRSGVQRPHSLVFDGLFGVFSDSLPDGWGLMLMDRAFRQRKIDPATVSPLDRLAYVGSRGLGALTYHPPADRPPDDRLHFDLDEIASQAERIAQGSPEVVLPSLLVLGGSPAGARPKILVGYAPTSREVIADASTLPPGFERWLVKFRAKSDEPAAGRIEEAYHTMARSAGIQVPRSALFTSRIGDFFASRRFDRDEGDQGVHTHSFGGLVHADFRLPNLDYQDLLETTLDLTRRHADLEEVYRRMVFNVLAHNRDDHVKNFSFQLRATEGWSLAPAYDLTYSDGVRGEHNMTVLGRGRPTVADCLKLAERVGLPPRRARAIVGGVSEAIAGWPKIARGLGVPPGRAKEINVVFEAIRKA